MVGSGVLKHPQDIRCDRQESADRCCFCYDHRLPSRPRDLLGLPRRNTPRWAFDTQWTTYIPSSLINSIAVKVIPQIPFDSFSLCIYSLPRKIEISYAVISLLYGMAFQNRPCFHMVTPTPFLEDLLAFLVILRLPGRWTIQRFGVPGLLGTIRRDATKYFLVIFTAQLVLVITILFARVSSTVHFGNYN